MFKLLTIIIIFQSSLIFSQSDSNYKTIQTKGLEFITPLKNGEIESLKNITPPEGTWKYSRLIEYKEDLKNSEEILFGSFIQPSKTKDNYGFNFFAYNDVGDYYFTAVVNFKIVENEVKIQNSYLFTEKEALKNWWLNAFNFYDGEVIKSVPKKYLYIICPPAPNS